LQEKPRYATVSSKQKVNIFLAKAYFPKKCIVGEQKKLEEVDF
jgi:hypothetical protein